MVLTLQPTEEFIAMPDDAFPRPTQAPGPQIAMGPGPDRIAGEAGGAGVHEHLSVALMRHGEDSYTLSMNRQSGTNVLFFLDHGQIEMLTKMLPFYEILRFEQGSPVAPDRPSRGACTFDPKMLASVGEAAFAAVGDACAIISGKTSDPTILDAVRWIERVANLHSSTCRAFGAPG